MLFLEYPRCSTCRRAKKWLDDHGLVYEDRDITKDNPTVEELTNWYTKSDKELKRFFNTSGVLYRELGLKDKLLTLTEKQQIELLASDGKLVKRPLVILDNAILIGFKQEKWEDALL